jgi:glucan biosynthesis protein C
MVLAESTPSPSMRRKDLDWLRILAVLLLVPFHGALVFVQNPHSVVYLKDTLDSFFLDRMDGFIDQWHMPILFIIAGMSTYFALKKRGSGQYLHERVLRLLIPLLFGIAVLVPLMTYITQIAKGNPPSFWEHYIKFFSFGSDFNGLEGYFTPAHLWFILYLIVFSLVALPLFQLLRRSGSQGLIQGMGWFFGKPLTILFLVILLALGKAIDIMDNLNPIYFFLIFVFGYLLMTDERYQKAIDRYWPIMVMLGVIFEVMRQTWNPEFAEWSFPWVMREMAMHLNRWVWVLAILGMGHRFINRGGKALNYLTEAAYPIYIIHFLILTVVSYFVVQINAPIAVKYILIIGLTFGSIFVVYEGVRRVSPLRFLCGMKGKKQPAIEKKSELVQT